jgi:hypothetical protein
MPVSSAELSRFVKEAGFIFRGRLMSSQKSAAHGSAAEQTLLAVEIEEVLLSTDVLRGFRGKIVTVLGEHAASVEDEGLFFFFTNCIVLGDRLVVREVGRIRASPDADRAVTQAIKEAAEHPLRERVATAELVVQGHVTASGPADPNAVQKSEHDPIWWIARVSVDSVLKGREKTSRPSRYSSPTKVSGLAAQKCMFLGNRTRLDGALLSERGNWIEALALGW